RPRNYAEITVLGIHSEQTPVANFHPRDVIANGRHFPAVEVRGGNQHCEIGFAAGAGKRGSDVMFSSLGRFNADNQHVLRHPAVHITLNMCLPVPTSCLLAPLPLWSAYK